MYGLGTIINAVGIVLGGIAGLLFGNVLKERQQEGVNLACGVGLLFIGVAGAMEGMLSINGGNIASGRSMLVIVCLSLGALVGETLNIEGWFERFGEWLKIKTGNAKDKSFVNGFVTASLTVSIGAMAIVGSIQDGMTGDWSILGTKAMIDFIIVMVMTCSMGKGCAFSAIPVLIFEGAMTALAVVLKPLMTELALNYLSMIGSMLIFSVGINLVWGKKIRAANMLPALAFAVIAAFLPI